MLQDDDANSRKSKWCEQSWSIPDFAGGKDSYYPLIVRLLALIREGKMLAFDDVPDLGGITGTPRTWREYASFLRSSGLARNRAGVLCLTDIGSDFIVNPTRERLADILQGKYRLFGELLPVLSEDSLTVQEVNQKICLLFNLDWKNCSHTRKRMDWLEVSGLIEGAGNRRWRLTEQGCRALREWELVTPELVDSFASHEGAPVVKEPPFEIEEALKRLKDEPSLHIKRSTYNIWVPSPNRIDNLRDIVVFANDKVSRKELFCYIESHFNLKASSVESMLPFLKASDLIAEVGRALYTSTPAARAWNETGNDLDFIRILHANFRFVGEMIDFAKSDVTRNEIYEHAKLFGLNAEKARWIAGFLLEAGLLEESRYLHLRATSLGIVFASELPLADASEYMQIDAASTSCDASLGKDLGIEGEQPIFQRLRDTARDPLAEGGTAGIAFEKAFAEIFSYAGFEVRHIGGSGDTDVLVRWKSDDGGTVVATVDGKSKSSGLVAHGDISDIALETHRDKHNAQYMAVVGPGFGGDTIRSHAQKKGFALISDEELVQIVKTSHALGLSLDETALIFQSPDGISKFEELATTKQREMDIISLTVSTFIREQSTYGSLSARDLSLLLKHTDVSPSIEELISVFELLASQEIGLLRIAEGNQAKEHVTYAIVNEVTIGRRMRAIASAIEAGIERF